MRKVIIFAIILSLLAICSISIAEEVKRTAVVAEVKGTVDVKTADGNWTAAKTGMVLNQGDIIRTKEGSSAILNVDGTAQTATVQVKEKSQLMLAELIMNKDDNSQKTTLDLALGEILVKAKKLHSEKSSFEVKTPTSVAAVRGTSFSVSVEAME